MELAASLPADECLSKSSAAHQWFPKLFLKIISKMFTSEIYPKKCTLLLSDIGFHPLIFLAPSFMLSSSLSLV